MELDIVQDIQRSYRKLLDCMARPGQIGVLSDICKKLDDFEEVYPATNLLMRLLLDGEVGFHVLSDRPQSIYEQICPLTYGKIRGVEEADFIFVTKDAGEKGVKEAIGKGKAGNLINPHRSATIVVEAGITKERDIVLTGPGIQTCTFIKVDLGYDWIQERAQKNQEYPLGVDMIFVDANANLLCLPRTTQIARG